MPAIFIHVQHLLGIGHQRRMAAIARGLCARGARVTYATGGMPLPDLDTGPATVLQLPPVRVADARYQRYLDATGREIDAAWCDNRRQILLHEYERVSPDVVLLETFPFGRRMFRFELLPLLEAAKRAHRPAKVAVSIRDILEPRKKADREAETLRWLDAYVDEVLVHGDPAVAALDTGFSRAAEVGQKLRYTGYVCADMVDGRPRGCGEILVSAGGGAVGRSLLLNTARARGKTAHAHRAWRFVTGNSADAALNAELRALAGPGAIVERNRDDFGRLLSGAALSISQAGYNTATEAVKAGCRQLLLPFAEHGEREQLLRAQAFAGVGLATYLPPSEQSSMNIAQAVDRTVAAPPPAPTAISVDGVRNTVDAVLALAAR